MKITLEPGHYVVAVSGGVDSVALLHALQQVPGVKLTVAHFDHGIRADSAEDRRLVKELAKQYGLPFVYAEGHLGREASEATARQARYDFLHAVRQSAGADAVVTAHHQDDVLETAMMNILRGTGRKGLTSLQSTDIVKRPLLHLPKSEIRNYAAANGLKWREDSTNDDQTYRRNFIRHNVVAHMTTAQREQLHALIVQLRQTNADLDSALEQHLYEHHSEHELNRHTLIMLPHAVAREVMASWLRLYGIRDFDTKTLERLVVAAKTKPAGKIININSRTIMALYQHTLALIPNER